MKISFDEISPVTGNKCVLVEPHAQTDDKMKLCTESGYRTMDREWKDGSDFIVNAEKHMPRHMVNSRIVDENKNVWYKLLNITPFLAFIPEVEGERSVWNIYRVREVENESEPVVLPLQITDDPPTYVNHTVDIPSRIQYDGDNFPEAYSKFCDLLAVIINKITDGKINVVENAKGDK